MGFLRGLRVVREGWRCRGGGEGLFAETGETLFVFQDETFVACVDVDGFDAAVSVDSDCVHEP